MIKLPLNYQNWILDILDICFGGVDVDLGLDVHAGCT